MQYLRHRNDQLRVPYFSYSRRSEPPTVVVLASGRTANLVPATTGHPKLRLALDEDEVLHELEVVCIRQRRLALESEEAGERSPGGSTDVLVVASGPLDPKVRHRVDTLNAAVPGRSSAAVICLGCDDFPRVVVDQRGGISTSGELAAFRRVRVMTETEAAAALVSSAPSAPALYAPGGQLAGTARDATQQSSAAVISVRLLGPYRISAGDREVASGLRAKARELLAYLAVNREGATMDAAIEALWPEADPDKGQAYFRTVVANLRTTLRAGAGLDDAVAVIERIGQRYRLDADFVAVDLWQFRDRIAELDRDDIEAIRAKAADCYGGDFTAGEDFFWAEPVREQLRRTAIDNLMALAELRRAAGDVEGALRATEHAIEFDLYGEELYRSAMKMQLSLGRRDAAGRTLRLLEQRLADLDMQPQDATCRLLSEGVSEGSP